LFLPLNKKNEVIATFSLTIVHSSYSSEKKSELQEKVRIADLR